MPRERFVRGLVADVERSLRGSPPLIQILVGARQTGKSTAAEQIIANWQGPAVHASADLPLPPGPDWVETHWMRARDAGRADRRRRVLLVLDEVQKVHGWSEAVKSLWEEDRRRRILIRPLLLGSSALMLQKGLTETLAGRFFLHRCPHWCFGECQQAFGWTLERWLFFGGYPGAAPLARSQEAWRRYVADSLIETAIARDVLALQRVGKPALLRHVFALAAQFPAEILSYTKMLGTLQDAGNTVTLAHYLKLLEGCFLLSGLEVAAGRVRQRGSSPKLIFWNNALVTALSGLSFAEARRDTSFWGRLVENAYGAHLLNHLPAPRFTICYWRDRGLEVDFVIQRGRSRVAIEVKSGRPGRHAGLDAFRRRFPSARTLIVGRGGLPLEEAFGRNPEEYLSFG